MSPRGIQKSMVFLSFCGTHHKDLPPTASKIEDARDSFDETCQIHGEETTKLYRDTKD